METPSNIADWRRWVEIAGREPIDALSNCGQLLATRLEDLRGLLAQVDARRLLVVVDRAAVSVELRTLLEQQFDGLNTCVFDRFTPNPCYASGVAASKAAAEFSANAILAIGGGSCLDVAKFAALAAGYPDEFLVRSLGREFAALGALPIVAVPTTSGSGSEATHFAVLYLDRRKYSIANGVLRPTAVVLDPRFHLSMPDRLAAVTGLDALSHSLESIWAVGATSESIRLAEIAGRSIVASIEGSVVQGDYTNRVRMMIGAHLAGQAINISKTTAAHALSYELSQLFGLSHGHAVSLTLGWIGAFNDQVTEDDCVDSRGSADVRCRLALAAGILGASPCELPLAVHSLLERLRLPATLAEAGVTPGCIERLAARVDHIRLGNNPRRLERRQIEHLLTMALRRPSALR